MNTIERTGTKWGVEADKLNENFQELSANNVITRNKHREDGLMALSGYNLAADRIISATKYKAHFSMGVITDLHGSSVAIDNFVAYINNYKRYFDAAINLGDVAESSPLDDASYFTSEAIKSEIPFLTILGNHDRKQGDPELSITDSFNKFIKPLADEGFFTATLPYYYKDFVNPYYKIRVIALNPYGAESAVTLPTSDYSVRATYWDETQMNWLADLLFNTPDDYSVIIGLHNPDDGIHTIVDSSFSTYILKKAGTFNNDWYKLQDGNVVYDLVNAWKNSLTFNETYLAINDNNALDDITIVKDFSAKANGKFVCYITGHRHRQIVCTVPSYTDQLLITFDTSSAYEHQRLWGDMLTEANTLSEDNFTALGVDTENKLIKLFKVGSTRTIHGEIRDYEAISYDL